MTTKSKYKPDHPFSPLYRGSLVEELTRFRNRAHEPAPGTHMAIGPRNRPLNRKDIKK